jgi:hypothetical protein
MKQSIFDKIKEYIEGCIRRLCKHGFGCCQKITKNCSKCERFTDADHYKWDGTKFVEVEK